MVRKAWCKAGGDDRDIVHKGPRDSADQLKIHSHSLTPKNGWELLSASLHLRVFLLLEPVPRLVYKRVFSQESLTNKRCLSRVGEKSFFAKWKKLYFGAERFFWDNVMLRNNATQ